MGLLSSVIAILSWFYLNYVFLFFLDESTDNPSNKQKIIVMSYNVWFLEDLELTKRMKVFDELIQLYIPELLCFQARIVNIFSSFPDDLSVCQAYK
jgi:hypothetical protein